MENKQFIKINDEAGNEIEVQVLLLFKLEEFNKEYIIYTLNETNDKNLTKIYASTFIEKESGYELEDIASDLEWTKVKDAMREVINANKE